MNDPYRSPESEIREEAEPSRYRAAFVGAASGFVLWLVVSVGLVYSFLGFVPAPAEVVIRMSLAAGIAGIVLTRLPKLKWYSASLLGIVLTALALYGLSFVPRINPF